jgi:hypothetical protein
VGVIVFEKGTNSVEISGNDFRGFGSAEAVFEEEVGLVNRSSIGVWAARPGVNRTADGIVVSGNSISNFDIGVVLPSDGSGRVSDNEIAACAIGILSAGNQHALSSGNSIRRCETAYAATSRSTFGHDALFDVRELLLRRSALSTFPDGLSMRVTRNEPIGERTNWCALSQVNSSEGLRLRVRVSATATWQKDLYIPGNCLADTGRCRFAGADTESMSVNVNLSGGAICISLSTRMRQIEVELSLEVLDSVSVSGKRAEVRRSTDGAMLK